MPLKTFSSQDVTKKRVFLRADLNVPLDGNHITNDFRLKALMPTINQLHHSGAKIILASHLGKPKPEAPDPNLSTQNLAPWFVQHGLSVDFEPDITDALAKSHQSPATILLLENLRFFKGEKSADPSLALQLARLADIYVNDAFGTMHRADTSVAILPGQFSQAARFIGLLVQKEITALEHIRNNPTQPFMLVIGGAKLDDKIALISRFLLAPQQQRINTLMVGGALALAFLKAQGLSIGASQLSSATIKLAQDAIQIAQANQVTLLTPLDMATIKGSLGSSTEFYPVTHIPANSLCVDIGPQTIKHFSQSLAHAKTIFANGTMGICEYNIYSHGSHAVLSAIAAIHGHTVVGGGDTVAALEKFGLETSFSFVSSGGGATLAYLGAKDPLQELPGLKALDR